MLRGDLPYPHGTRSSPFRPPYTHTEDLRPGGVQGGKPSHRGPTPPHPHTLPQAPLGRTPGLAATADVSTETPNLSPTLDLTPGLAISVKGSGRQTHGRLGTYCSVPSGRVFPGPQVSRISA